MATNMRLTLNWRDAEVLLNLFNGIDPETVEDLAAMEDMKIRLETNYNRHRAALVWEKRRDEILADLKTGQVESITKSREVTRQTPEDIAEVLRENSERLGYKD
jgi:hypothetical protein